MTSQDPTQHYCGHCGHGLEIGKLVDESVGRQFGNPDVEAYDSNAETMDASSSALRMVGGMLKIAATSLAIERFVPYEARPTAYVIAGAYFLGKAAGAVADWRKHAQTRTHLKLIEERLGIKREKQEEGK